VTSQLEALGLQDPAPAIEGIPHRRVHAGRWRLVELDLHLVELDARHEIGADVHRE